MPPIWRRSLTESGMERKTTTVDHVVVALFVLICVGVVVLLVMSLTGG